MEHQDLVTGREIDRAFLWPAGRSEKLARRDRLPHYRLPDNSIRFRLSEVLPLVRPAGSLPPASSAAVGLGETRP